MTVYLDDASDLPASIQNENIDPYMDSDRGRVKHFFGDIGRIVVQKEDASNQ